MGLIDVENSLRPEEVKEKRRKKYYGSGSDMEGSEREPYGSVEHNSAAIQLDRRKREKKKRRSQSPKVPPGGCYRIPQQGQLQIVIKNPNKTAVKLFLVPYNLQGMEPGTKTFLRQRSYSAGPIVDMPLTSKPVSGPGPESPATGLQTAENPMDKPILRYLIHLNICCTAKGRYYLYQSIRVVFANRVPDGKEKLRNETESPNPRYSAYKPGKAAGAGLGSNHNGISDKALRRRSFGFALGSGGFDAMDGIDHGAQAAFAGGDSFPFGGNTATAPIEPIPFNLTFTKKEPSDGDNDEEMDIDSSEKVTTMHGRSHAISQRWQIRPTSHLSGFACHVIFMAEQLKQQQ